MWTTVLVLAIAVNFEPTRIGLITFMLTRRHPIRQLSIFLLSALVLSGAVGVLVLFVFHRGYLGSARVGGPEVQIGIGALMLLLAAVVASNIPLGRFGAVPADGAGPAAAGPLPPDGAGGTAIGRVATRARRVLHSDSHWFSGMAGAGLAMPGVEYMALLALIIASNKPPAVQLLALFVFLAVANAVSAIPLISYLIAPERTRAGVQRFNAWIRSRRRRDVAIALAVAGCLLVGIGIAGM